MSSFAPLLLDVKLQGQGEQEHCPHPPSPWRCKTEKGMSSMPLKVLKIPTVPVFSVGLGHIFVSENNKQHPS
jgi:hypothetical protein